MGGLAGCSTLPAAGPTTHEIISQEAETDAFAGYVLIDVDKRVADVLAQQPRETLYGTFRNQPPPPTLRIGTGDTLMVTIWEAGSGGLFSSSAIGPNPGSRTATLPEQAVARDGTVQVPYAGRVRAAGRTPAQVEEAIVASLQGKAIEPQAVVTVTRNVSSTATVMGEVAQGMRVPLSLKGDRLLDVVATAGGPRVAPHETFIRVTRRGRSNREITSSVAFNTILADPRENIFVHPGDVVTVVREPQTFTAFGGTGRNALVPFEATGITLEEAVAKAGGLLDFRADPTGVFLLRFESAPLVARLAPDKVDRFATAVMPVVYRLNLRDTNSYFLAQAIAVRNKDIVYVANAPLSEAQKVLNAIGTLTAPILQGAAVASATR